MSTNQIYKIYQVMEYFVTKYSFISVNIKNLVKNDEAFIVSKDDKNYSLIHISQESILSSKYDKERIDKIIEILSTQFNISNSNYLDIHISDEEVTGDEPFKTLALNTNHYSGEDLESIYPGIHNIIYDSDNVESDIKKHVDHINKSFRDLKEKAKKRPLLKKLHDLRCPATLIIMAICVILFLFTYLLEYKGYSASASLIVLGANYKMFTLGLNQYYRLITGAFLHSGLFHIFFNLWSFYIVGSVIERNLGTVKMLIMLFVGILFSSLTAGILQGNSLVIGLSGGIYTLFIYLICFYIGSGFININTLVPTLLLNLCLNFIPGVSWQTHLGGAICGIIFYYIYKDNKIDKHLCALLVVVLIGLGYKYIKDYNIKPYYAGTDIEALQIYYDIGLEKYATNKLEDLYKIYNS